MVGLLPPGAETGLGVIEGGATMVFIGPATTGAPFVQLQSLSEAAWCRHPTAMANKPNPIRTVENDRMGFPPCPCYRLGRRFLPWNRAGWCQPQGTYSMFVSVDAGSSSKVRAVVRKELADVRAAAGIVDGGRSRRSNA